MLTISQALTVALEYHQSGHLQQAEEIYKEILQVDPNQADALHLLGVASHQQGRNEQAVAYISQAIRNNSERAEFHSNLGEAYRALGRLVEAAAEFQIALRLNPDMPEAHNNLGEVYRAQNQLADATREYQEALRLRPNMADAHLNWGLVLHQQNRTEEALAQFQQVLHVPAAASLHAKAQHNIGAIFQNRGELYEAAGRYQEALRLDPGYAIAHNSLGRVFHELGEIDKAMACYQEALRLKPSFAEAHQNAGAIFHEQGDFEQAKACYEQALRLKPDERLRVTLATLLPIIYDSVEQLHAARQSLEKNVRRLRQDGVKLDLTDSVAPPNFFLAYQGLNDRDLLADLASLYQAPGVGSECEVQNVESQTRTPLEGRQLVSHRKIRVGVISHFFRDHTIGRLTEGLVANLSRAEFEVVVLSLGGREDSVTESFRRAADIFVRVPPNLAGARQTIAAHQLDILLYTDIGMDPLTYTLAFSRLAPVQCTTWGHPSTTGIPAIDHFISSELFETPDARQHYTENLVLFRGLTTYYYRPETPVPQRGRELFGLEEKAHLYACPQSLFKFHPEFDVILAGILRADPAGLLLLVRDLHRGPEQLLMKRFSRTMPDVVDRIKFVPRQNRSGFLCLLGAADVLLDPIHFGGGNTSLEALALGTPIVTWPSPFLRGRLTLGMYRRMQFLDCVAASPREYVDIAVKLGTDADYRADVREKIRIASNGLYEDMESIREWERFFAEAIES